MSKLTLGQAAKLTGVSKSTISRALKNGQLSYTSRSTAGYEIEPAELFRAFPPKQHGTVAIERSGTPDATPKEPSQNTTIIDELRRQIEDLKSDRDAWREQAQRLALTDQRSPATEEKSRSFWKRLRGQ